MGIEFSVTVEAQLAQSFETDLRQMLDDLGLAGRVHVGSTPERRITRRSVRAKGWQA